MSSNGPPPTIQRPIPRRPFVVSPATPPADDERKDEAKQPQKQRESTEFARFLDTPLQQQTNPDFADSPTAGGDSISRKQSILNLTSSTLFGIFSPTVTSRGSLVGDGTPWGTGAETPARKLLDEGDEDNAEAAGDDDDDNVDGEATGATAAELDEVRKASQSLMMLQRERRRGASFGADGVSGIKLASAPAGRGSKNSVGAAVPAASSPTSTLLPSRSRALVSVLGRAALLFALGMGYGVLVSRLRSESDAFSALDDLVVPPPPLASSAGANAPIRYDASYDWRYLVSWGASGVVLGTLLPWFDGVWDRTFGGRRSGDAPGKGRSTPETDWALVVRGIGAFAGVAFAMRKLPWASAMQASLTLALANPFLWYLLDRSKSGLLLAAAVGFIGSGALMVLNLDLMPRPGAHQPHLYPVDHDVAGVGGGGAVDGASFHRNSSSSNSGSSSGSDGGGGNFNAAPSPAMTAEMAIWMLSVLFCSCVCFGNIGRRLALRPIATARGQWAGDGVRPS
ncbi:insig domain containing protein [Niveomyces insectorum RCEF 264]|uniref:Insig domain containing protein n=1 Tax=Niveomyces insectorum RCEF 264 TaxID=1081102 RepID=A0A167PGX1_9HYPO|nr:insig domain containing protein [Niveomyces insectorum RCEF 264]